ncbi:Pro-Pol polyprotein [Gossypium australe]|uniref:Pro-Pol polyprotein n=1 Tax=Gossypium australe TaxID=47621 RepID=A0A5B6W9G5_9ROSI|nr:Pro-Pol polyprotein [Gossypium australe]
MLQPNLNNQTKRKFLHDKRCYYSYEPFLFKKCADQIVRNCVLDDEIHNILQHYHLAFYGGHFGGMRTPAKVLQSGFYWSNLFKDAQSFYKPCDRCQRIGNNSRRHEMSLQNILEVELFDVWRANFMVDYVSKWVEVVVFPTNDSNSVMKFLHKNVLMRFGTPRAIISDEGFHFDCKLITNALHRYGVKHKLATTYHPQTN